MPTNSPTAQPSRQPTSRPTSQPSRQPTAQPSRQPSSQPSGKPSQQPTGQPTGKPSRQPSQQPTAQPSCQPTSPTGQPSRQPSSHPSSQPSAQPVSNPTLNPTLELQVQLQFSLTHTLSGAALSVASFDADARLAFANALAHTVNSRNPVYRLRASQINIVSVSSTPASGLRRRQLADPTIQVDYNVTALPTELGTRITTEAYDVLRAALSDSPGVSTSLQLSSNAVVATATANAVIVGPSVVIILHSAKPTPAPTAVPTVAFCYPGFHSVYPDCAPCPAGSYCDQRGYNVPATPCPSGAFSGAQQSACTLCPLGSFARGTGATSCSPVQAGYYPVSQIKGTTAQPLGVLGAADEAPCALGFFSSTAMSTGCTPCAQRSFADQIASVACILCPNNRITPNLGATSVDQCVSISTNYAIAALALIAGVFLFYEYVVQGRFFQVALQRRGVKEGLRRVCHGLYNRLRISLEEHRVREGDNDGKVRRHSAMFRVLRLLLFALGVLFIAVVLVLLQIFRNVHKIFYSSFILWRALPLDVASRLQEAVHDLFLDALVRWVNIIAVALDVVALKPFVLALFYPFIALIGLIKDINFKALLNNVDVTCEGSIAPIEILGNIFIFGLVVLVIESDFLLITLSRKQLCGYYFKRHIEPIFRKRVKMPFPRLPWRLACFTLLGSVATAPLFKALLQYLMTLLVVSRFFMPRGVPFRDGHPYTAACASISPQGLDQYFAILATIVSYITAYPALYTIARVCAPPRAGSEDECSSFAIRASLRLHRRLFKAQFFCTLELSGPSFGADSFDAAAQHALRAAIVHAVNSYPADTSFRTKASQVDITSIADATDKIGMDDKVSKKDDKKEGQEKSGQGHVRVCFTLAVVPEEMQPPSGHKHTLGEEAGSKAKSDLKEHYATVRAALSDADNLQEKMEVMDRNVFHNTPIVTSLSCAEVIMPRYTLPAWTRLVFPLEPYDIRQEWPIESSPGLSIGKQSGVAVGENVGTAKGRGILSRTFRALFQLAAAVTARLFVYVRRLVSLASPDLWIMHVDALLVAAVASFKQIEIKRRLKPSWLEESLKVVRGAWRRLFSSRSSLDKDAPRKKAGEKPRPSWRDTTVLGTLPAAWARLLLPLLHNIFSLLKVLVVMSPVGTICIVLFKPLPDRLTSHATDANALETARSRRRGRLSWVSGLFASRGAAYERGSRIEIQSDLLHADKDDGTWTEATVRSVVENDDSDDSSHALGVSRTLTLEVDLLDQPAPRRIVVKPEWVRRKETASDRFVANVCGDTVFLAHEHEAAAREEGKAPRRIFSIKQRTHDVVSRDIPPFYATFSAVHHELDIKSTWEVLDQLASEISEDLWNEQSFAFAVWSMFFGPINLALALVLDLFVAIGPGQIILTRCGFHCFVRVLDRFLALAEVSAGVWSDEHIRSFEVHSNVRSHCSLDAPSMAEDACIALFRDKLRAVHLLGMDNVTSFEDAGSHEAFHDGVRLKMEALLRRGYQQGYVTQGELNALQASVDAERPEGVPDPFPLLPSEQRHPLVEGDSASLVSVASCLYETLFEAHIPRLSEEALKDRATEDIGNYSTVLTSVVVPRSILFQVVPTLTFLSIYASFMSESPLFLALNASPESLNDRLPMFYKGVALPDWLQCCLSFLRPHPRPEPPATLPTVFAFAPALPIEAVVCHVSADMPEKEEGKKDPKKLYALMRQLSSNKTEAFSQHLHARSSDEVLMCFLQHRPDVSRARAETELARFGRFDGSGTGQLNSMEALALLSEVGLLSAQDSQEELHRTLRGLFLTDGSRSVGFREYFDFIDRHAKGLEDVGTTGRPEKKEGDESSSGSGTLDMGVGEEDEAGKPAAAAATPAEDLRAYKPAEVLEALAAFPKFITLSRWYKVANNLLQFSFSVALYFDVGAGVHGGTQTAILYTALFFACVQGLLGAVKSIVSWGTFLHLDNKDFETAATAWRAAKATTTNLASSCFWFFFQCTCRPLDLLDRAVVIWAAVLAVADEARYLLIVQAPQGVALAADWIARQALALCKLARALYDGRAASKSRSAVCVTDAEPAAANHMAVSEPDEVVHFLRLNYFDETSEKEAPRGASGLRGSGVP